MTARSAAPKRPPSSSPRRASAKSEAEEALATELARVALPGWDLEREYRFHDGRKWRFDFAFPSLHLAIEVDGSGHQRFGKTDKDNEKLNEAAKLGWRVLRFRSRDKKKAAEWAAFIVECLTW
jgi:very-short-patch-repair endonuclease